MSLSDYQSCRLCGRACRVDRASKRAGFCGETDEVRLAMTGIHFGEEPPLVGQGGSGTVFFSGCGLQCAFCQNRQISSEGIGRVVGIDELAGLFIQLQVGGAENINLVTATHFAPSVAAAVSAARAGGLFLPVLWNSSGYDSAQALDCLGDAIDVWLPDLKTLDPELSAGLFGIANYPEVAGEAIVRMAGHRPLRRLGGMLVSGVIVRHLVLPGRAEASLAVIDWFAEHLAGRALLSLMCQYTPVPGARTVGLPFAAERRLRRHEYEQVTAHAGRAGIEDGFVQELPTDEEAALLPDFSRTEPFPEKLARTVWSALGPVSPGR